MLGVHRSDCNDFTNRSVYYIHAIRLRASRPYRAPPPPRTAEGGFIFFYRCLVFPKKCPQRKACAFRSYSG